MVHRYVLREVSAPLPAALGLLVLVLLLLQAERLGPLVFSAVTTPEALGTLLLATIPLLVTAAMPAALLVAVVAGLGRMAHDQELLALRALGRRPTTTALAPMLLAAGIGLVVLASGLWLEPICRGHLAAAAGRLALGATRGALVPGEILELTPGLTFFARERGEDAELRAVALHDDRDEGERWLLAARMGVTVGRAGELRLHLEDGEVHARPADDRLLRLRFGTLMASVDVAGAVARRTHWLRAFEALPVSEAIAEAERMETDSGATAAAPLRFFIWQRVAAAVACMAFALLGVALAPAGSGAGGTRWRPIALGVLVAAAYYALGRATETAAHTGQLLPWFAALLPAAIVGVVGVIVLWRPWAGGPG